MTPLRIGLVTDTWFPARNGVVASVATLRRELQRLGHEVTILAVAPEAASELEGVHRFRGLWLLPSVEGRLGLVTAGAVRRAARRARLDLLHTHTEFTAGWAARRVARRLQLPLVHTLHTAWDQYVHYFPGGRHVPAGMVRRLLASYVATAALVSVPSTKAQRWAEPWVGDRSLVVLGNPVAEHFRPAAGGAQRAARNALGLQRHDRVALIVGRLALEKRVLPLLTALTPALEQEPRLVLVFVGTGPDASRLAGMARRSGVRHRVRLTGATPWEKMPQWYAAADVLVSASRSEFHPVAVLEAMACGLPVVAGGDAAFDSLVAHGDTGLRAATDAGIASAVLRVLDDSDLRRRLAAGSVAASRHHRGATVAARWEAIYRRLLGQSLGSSDVSRREDTALTAGGAPPTLTLPVSNLPLRPEFH